MPIGVMLFEIIVSAARRGFFAAFDSVFDIAAKRISLPGNDFRLPAHCRAKAAFSLP
jgi:hypothetical protein